MSDIALVFDKTKFACDFVLENGSLKLDDGMTTGVLISVFSDGLANEEDDVVDRRGFWADAFDTDKLGSRLYILKRLKQTNETLLLAKEIVGDCLKWMIEDGVVKSIEVEAEYLATGVMGLAVDIAKPDGSTFNYQFQVIWGAHSNA